MLSFPGDAAHFHQALRDMCDARNRTQYPSFKDWCDRYFWNSQQNSAWGIDGIICDNLGEGRDEHGLEDMFRFMQDFLKAFLLVVYADPMVA